MNWLFWNNWSNILVYTKNYSEYELYLHYKSMFHCQLNHNYLQQDIHIQYAEKEMKGY